ncbi:MAG: hypothetical protein U5K84_10980 [Alkalibacterium sp.]|nr:hypothetical protein [Alkalibacterium sp.]
MKQRGCILHAILKRLSGWNHSFEEAQGVLEENQIFFEKLKEVDSELSEAELSACLEEQQLYIKAIVQKQQALISVLKNQSARLSEQLTQVQQKSHVVSHYMNKDQSLFIDREA